MPGLRELEVTGNKEDGPDCGLKREGISFPPGYPRMGSHPALRSIQMLDVAIPFLSASPLTGHRINISYYCTVCARPVVKRR